MKKQSIFFTACMILLVLVAFSEREPVEEKSFKTSFINTLKNAKAYTIEVANKMPEEEYTFRPHDSVRSFGEQMAHIAMSTNFMHTMFIKGEPMKFDPVEGAKMEKEVGASKAACIEHLNKTFDDAISKLESMSNNDLQQTFVFPFLPDKPELTKEEGYIFIRDHITHHRGQAITTLRIKGHEAPPYRAF